MKDYTDDELRELLDFEREVSAHAAVGKLDRWMAGDRSPEVEAAMRVHVASCAPCRETLETYEAMLAEGARAASRRRRVGWFALAGTALVAAGVTLVASQGASPSGLVAKGGGGDRLHVVMHRGETAQLALTGTLLADGDRLEFFYDADAPGHLAVYALAAGAPPTRLADLVVAPGRDVPLGAGAVITPGDPCEVIVAVFDDVALDHARVAERLARAALIEPGCAVVHPELGARSTVVLAFPHTL